MIKMYRGEQGGGGLFDGLVPDTNDLAPITSIQGESGDTCSEMEGIDIDEALALYDEIEPLIDLGFSAEELRSFYSDLDVVCADGYITNEEAQELSSKHAFLQGN